MDDNLLPEDFDFELASDNEQKKVDENFGFEFNADEDDKNIRYTDNSRMAYSDALRKKEIDLEDMIILLEEKIKKAKIFTKRSEIKKMALQKQLEAVRKEKMEYLTTRKNKYRDKAIIHGLDKFHNGQAAKERDIIDQIRHLRKQGDKTDDVGARKRIYNQIDKKILKLERLQKREVRVTKMQRSIIMFRKVLQRKKHKLAKQEAKKDYYQNKEEYTHTLKNNLEYSNTITGNIKKSVLGTVYGLKEKRYKRKKEKREAVLKELKNKRFIGVVGANVIATAKRAVNKLSGNNELNEMFTDENLDNNQNINYSR